MANKGTTPAPISGDLSFLAGGGVVGARMRAFDWSDTALGPPEAWPQGLRVVVRLMLTTATPIFIYWGRDAIFLCNDAVASALGPVRLKSALGQVGRRAWLELWREIGDGIGAVMDGSVTHHRAKTLQMRDCDVLRGIGWNCTLSPIDDQESPSGIGGVVVMSSEIPTAECAKDAIAQERQRLLTVFERSSTFIAVVSGPDYRFEFVNKSYRDLVGRMDLIGRPVREALAEVEGQGFIDILDDVYETGAPFVARAMPVQLRRVSGELETRWLDFVYHRLDAAHGHAASIVAEGFDVTDRVVADRQLRSANYVFDAILAHSPDLIVTVDANGLISTVSDSSRQILGFGPSEMKGRPCRELFGSELEMGSIIDHVVAGEGRSRLEARCTRRDGSIATIRWAVVWASDLQMLIGVGRDVTQRLISEEAMRRAQKMETIGQLTGGVAHDFNNLLTVIIGSLEMLSDSVKGDGSLEPAALLALNAAERGAEVTSQLLSFARMQAHNPVVVSGDQLAAGFAPLVRTVVRENIHLEISGLSATWACVADRGQLEAALLNLALNARDAMNPHGWLAIRASVESFGADELCQAGDPLPGDYACIEVTDTGHGMDAEVMSRAVEPFFTTKPVGSGTGLGLSMVFGFVQQSGGFLRIKSECGVGTSVRIYLPNAPAADALGRETDTLQAGPAASILVVEDNDLLREQVGRQLLALGHEVALAEHGEQALDLLSSSATFDLLFTDIVMPGRIDGPSLAAHARRLRPELKILFTTGYAERVHGTVENFEGRTLTKPYKQAALAQAVREALEAS